MSDETSVSGGTEPDLGTAAGPSGQDAAMGAAEAAAIMEEKDQRARQAFRVSHRGSFVAWGAVTLVGYGVTWLAVHNAHPAQGPNPVGFALVSVLALASALASGAKARYLTTSAMWLDWPLAGFGLWLHS